MSGEYSIDDTYWALDRGGDIHIYVFNNDFSRVKNLENYNIFDISSIYHRGGLGPSISKSYDGKYIIMSACQKEYGGVCESVYEGSEFLNTYFDQLFSEYSRESRRQSREIDRLNRKIDKQNERNMYDYDYHVVERKSFDASRILSKSSFTLEELLDIKKRYQNNCASNSYSGRNYSLDF